MTPNEARKHYKDKPGWLLLVWKRTYSVIGAYDSWFTPIEPEHYESETDVLRAALGHALKGNRIEAIPPLL